MKSGGQYATQLRLLLTVIKKEFKQFDGSQLEILAQDCETYSYTSNTHWKYDLSELVFPMKLLKSAGLDNSRPKYIKSFCVVLSVEANGALITENTAGDTLESLVVNIQCRGYKVKTVDNEGDVNGTEKTPDALCAWHLDSHPPKGVVGNFDSPFAHPRYHWQYGGVKVWHNQDEWFGTHLLLESPRLIHPPLDAILAIDFVLANFYPLVWQKLRQAPQYQRIVSKVQLYYWKPYFEEIAAINWGQQPNDQSTYLYWPKSEQ